MTDHTHGSVEEGLMIVVGLGDGVAHLGVRGELDLSTSPLLDAAVQEALSSGASTVSFDLSDVSFVDSSGLAALLRAQHSCLTSGARFDIDAMSPRVARIVELAGVAELLPPR